MGLNLKRDMRRNVPINFTREEMSYYMKHFRQIDVENKGFLTLSDLKRHLQVSNLINFLSNRFTSMKIHTAKYFISAFEYLGFSKFVWFDVTEK
jgi:Ca2+-binding EF-hand superfamily protein